MGCSMNITSEQKQELIKQIVNNLTGQFIKKKLNDSTHLEFIIGVDKETIFRLQECACPSFNRDKTCFRQKMENTICDFINANFKKLEEIKLVNIGGDWVGLTVILAKLYLDGYRNFNIAVLDKDADCKINEQYLQFWKELFVSCTIINGTYAGVSCVDATKDISSNFMIKINPLFYMGSNLIIFAEDVGNSIIANNHAIDTFVNAVIKMRENNFALAQSLSTKPRLLKKLEPIIEAIQQGKFEQKLFFIKLSSAFMLNFEMHATTIRIQKINANWAVDVSTELLKNVTINKAEDKAEDKVVILNDQDDYVKDKRRKVDNGLFFSEHFSSSSSSIKTDEELANKLQQEQEDWLLAQALQTEEEQGGESLALSSCYMH